MVFWRGKTHKIIILEYELKSLQPSLSSFLTDCLILVMVLRTFSVLGVQSSTGLQLSFWLSSQKTVTYTQTLYSISTLGGLAYIWHWWISEGGRGVSCWEGGVGKHSWDPCLHLLIVNNEYVCRLWWLVIYWYPVKQAHSLYYLV